MARRKQVITEKQEGRFYTLLHWILFLLLLVNGCVVFFIERSRDPQIVKEVVTVTTNHLFIVTNYIHETSSTVDVDTNRIAHAAELSPANPAFEIPVRYRYFICDGRRYIEFWGRNFGEGSPTSYGRIATIYPERVLLENGYYLKNSEVAAPLISNREGGM